MKKISTNNDDCSFENKYKFEDLFGKVKAFGGSIIKNRKQTCFTAVMVGTVLFSANNIYKLGTDIVEAIEYYSEISEIEEYASSHNGDIVQKVNDDVILVVNNISSSIESKYHFKQNNLWDNEGNIISLNGVNKPICFVGCNINNETLKNIQLSSSKTEILQLDLSSVDDTFVNYLPNTIEALSLNNCNYITNLRDLPKRCPNITVISLNATASLSDLSFIYQLPNLKELYISDSAYITEDLLNYLRNNNIKTNITEQDIINSQKIDEIIDSIITPDMSDKDKIQTICLYVLNNVEYDVMKTLESNQTPLKCVLDDGKGVCISYAYLTNVLLNKAGIKSFEIINDSHVWNLVKLDNKYYYIDTTNMDDSVFYNFLLKTLNITKYYMIDTNNTFTTAMSKPEDDVTIIPLSLIEDIQNGRSDKDIFEKYGGQIGNLVVQLVSILYGVATYLGFFSLKKLVQTFPDLCSNIKSDYKEIIEEYNDYKKKKIVQYRKDDISF